jgi:hypothetical protein
MNDQELSDLRRMVAASGSPYGEKAMLEVDRLRAENASLQTKLKVEQLAADGIERILSDVRAENARQAATIAKLRIRMHAVAESDDCPDPVAWALREALKDSQ